MDDQAQFHAPGPDPEQEAATSQLRSALESAIMKLPNDYRLVFVLREIEGLSTADAAAALGISSALVKIRLHRARRLLRERLLDSGIGAGVFQFAGARCDRVVAAVMQRIQPRA